MKKLLKIIYGFFANIFYRLTIVVIGFMLLALYLAFIALNVLAVLVLLPVALFSNKAHELMMIFLMNTLNN